MSDRPRNGSHFSISLLGSFFRGGLVLGGVVTSLCFAAEGQEPASCVVSYRPGGEASTALPSDVLGSVDGSAISIGDEGSLVLGFPQAFRDGDGFDVTLFPKGETQDSCEVFVSSDGHNFTSIGTASPTGDGAVGFDLGAVGISSATILRIEDGPGGGTDGYRLDAVSVLYPVPNPPESTAVVTGTVRFPDDSTPVPEASVQLYSGANLVACDNADENGQVRLEVPPGSYQLVVVHPVPVRFIHRNTASEIYQPLDEDTDPDLLVSPTGVPTPSVLNPTMNWPLLMLHGTLVPGHSLGPAQLAILQPFLASHLGAALNAPRQAYLPIVPLMSSGGRRTYDEFFEALVELRAELRPHLTPRFSLLGFSQGGLVARRIVSRVGGAGIEKVILIAAANRGTCAADPALCEGCSEVDYVCPLAPSVVDEFNQVHTSGFGRPFYLIAGSLVQDACDCLAGVEDDGFVPVDSVFYLDGSLFPGSGLSYDVMDKRVIGPTEVPPDGPHHYRLRREQVVFDLVHGWLSTN